MGVVGIQRLLREAPSTPLELVLEPDSDAIDPNTPEAEVAVRLASYDLLALAVVDGAGRLLGAVTVDDMIDHLLPVDWRRGATT
jgi:Mg/Co/Ni transporter MgtE